ncbi:hypothetical protein [Natrinema sp. 1APR25-10V2]|uniref:hypothetical protein n=1 Tax=Natrinema sp. 1APR25-10V2 TaxID=2951081 RepID=UPI002875CD28|nr:hypothetical protein [Natrinema sp. 1APR25-10V2]MDS0476770.1 hypothetical protein [Natrinema sp. 1APR25-10V2]
MAAIENASSFDEFDADAILEKILEICGDQVHSFAEYDAETYNIIYMSEQMADQFDGEDDIAELSDRIHSDYRLDFTEKEMYEDVYGELGEVRAFSVFFDQNAIFRFVGERTGLYVSLAPDAPFNQVIEAVYDLIGEGSW